MATATLALDVCLSVHRAYPTEVRFLLSGRSERFSLDFNEHPVSVTGQCH